MVAKRNKSKLVRWWREVVLRLGDAEADLAREELLREQHLECLAANFEQCEVDA